MRVLTLDPVVHIDQFANTRFAFVVWSYTEDKAMILDKGASIAKQLAAIHKDEDYDNLNEVDVKISATGEGMETRYSVNVLPKTQTLTTDQAKACAALNLDDIIKNGTRMSDVNNGAKVSAEADPDFEEPLDLNDLPI